MTLKPTHRISDFIIRWIIPIGLFIYLSGQVIFLRNSGHITQTYIWLMFPTLVLIALYGRKIFSGYKLSMLDGLTVAFILLNVASFFWADTEDDFGRFYLDGLYILLFLISLITLVRYEKPLFSQVLELATVVVAIGAIGSIYYHFIVLDMPYGYRQARIFSGPWGYADLSNPIPAGLYFGVFGLIAFVRLLESRASLVWRTILFVSLIGLQTYVMLTWSRGPMYSLFAGYVILWLLRRDWHTTCLVIVLGLSAASISISSGMVSLPQENPSVATEQLPPQEALSSHQSQNTDEIKPEEQLNKTFNLRGTIWIGTFEQSMKAPWFGHGANSKFNVPFNEGKNIAKHAHNLYLQIFYETGFLGLILFILLYAFSARDCWKFRKDTLVQLSIALFVFGALAFTTDVSRIFRQPDPYWLLFWLPLGITIGIRLREQLGIIEATSILSRR